MEGDIPEREIDFDFDVSDEVGAAVYANIVSIWVLALRVRPRVGTHRSRRGRGPGRSNVSAADSCVGRRASPRSHRIDI